MAWIFVLLVALQLCSLSLEERRQNNLPQETKDQIRCPSQFVHVKRKCFFFSNGTATWQDAYHECKERKSSFAVIKGPKLNVALRNYLNNRRHHIRPEERWIGGIFDWEQQNWKWTGSQNNMTFKDFFYEKKGNASAWECVILDPKNQYKWNTRPCFLQKHYVCQWRRNAKAGGRKKPHQNGNKADNEIHVIVPAKSSREIYQHISQNDLTAPGFLRTQTESNATKKIHKKITCPSNYIMVKKKCYLFGTKKLTWQEAYWHCNDLNATLALLESNKEDVALKNMIKKHNKSTSSNWLGGRYDWEQMAWKWAHSGQLIQYQLNGAEEMRWHCLLWNPKLHKRWLAESCFEKHNYICQTNPSVMNIYRSRKLQSFSSPSEVKLDFSVDGTRKGEKLYKFG